MTHSRNEGRWSAVPAIGGLSAALLILSSCAREASSPVSPETAVVASSIQSAALKKAPGFQLTVTLAGTGNGMVKSSPVGIACGGAVIKSGNGGNGGNCNGVFSEEVTLTATGIGGSTFDYWSSDACNASPDPTTCTITGNVDEIKSVTAHFSKGAVSVGNQALTVLLDGSGSGTVDEATPGNICSTDDGGFCPWSFPTGVTVTLNATPDAGNSFSGWSVQSCTVATLENPSVCTSIILSTCSSSSDCVLSMTQPYTVTATFVPGLTEEVAVANSGSDGKPVGSAFLSGIGIATVTIDQVATRSAFIEQQR